MAQLAIKLDRRALSIIKCTDGRAKYETGNTVVTSEKVKYDYG
jgi:hypothetical protein